MKINQIILNNFGSYEGENIFETRVKSNKNIVLIGGKNGAGKTTLFTAIRLCLYGYMSLGHKSINSFYNRSVIKLINNAAKLKKPAQASISLNIELNNSHGVDEYVLTRSWILTDSLTEHFTVMKNGLRLSEDDISNFEKYILSLIPPELFNLYFFDGEKIADFFMEEGGNSRIKNAFLTLCGYDIFDIMRRNFKRISSSSEDSSPALTAYIEAKDVLEQETKEQTKIENEIISCNNAIDLNASQVLPIIIAADPKAGFAYIQDAYSKWKRKKFKGYDSKQSGPPPKEKTPAGRANPECIRYLYLCEDEQTPVYEVHPTIGQEVSVAKFKTKKPLKIYDLTLNLPDKHKNPDYDTPSLYDAVGHNFSVPNTGEPIQYLPTQYISEEIKNLGFDGLRFNSSLRQGGINVVLFDPEVCSMQSSDIVKVDSIEIKTRKPDVYSLESLDASILDV